MIRAGADVAIIVVGLDESYEEEGVDRMDPCVANTPALLSAPLLYSGESFDGVCLRSGNAVPRRHSGDKDRLMYRWIDPSAQCCDGALIMHHGGSTLGA